MTTPDQTSAFCAEVPRGGKVGHGNSPAAIVSPARLINTLPISLLSFAVSNGIPSILPELPCVALILISTEAVVPFCNTLGFVLVTTPLSEIDNSLLIVAGRFIE